MFEKLDKTDWKVMNLICDEPYGKFYLREISKILNISPSSSKKALDVLKKFNLTKEEKIANLRIVSGNINERLLKELKITKNIDFVRPIIEKIEPASSIVLYGSFAKGENDINSDIDLFVISNKKENFKFYEYKGYSLQIIKRTAAQWSRAKKENNAFANEIKKGILLKGEMPG
jgi:predicted nucleotidyltransferase